MIHTVTESYQKSWAFRTFKLRDPTAELPFRKFLSPDQGGVSLDDAVGSRGSLLLWVAALEVLRFTLCEARGLHRAYMLYKRQQTWFPMANTKSREALESPVIVFWTHSYGKELQEGLFFEISKYWRPKSAHNSMKNKKLRLFPTSKIYIFQHSINMYWVSE